MKPILATLFILVLLVGSVNAIVLSNPVPTHNSYLLGDGTEQFSVDTSTPAIIGTLWINNGGWQFYNMDCSSGTQCKVTPNLATYADLSSYNYYFVVDSTNEPPFPNVYTFNIDRVPTIPTGLTCTGLTETTLHLDWNNNPEADINYYELERDGSIVYSGATSETYDSGLSLGINYTYRVRVVDNRNQVSGWTTTVTCSPEDMTPPAQPMISLPSPATYTTMTPSINITYAESVNLRIYSGSTLIQNLGWCTNCVWNPSFITSDGTYNFNFRARDASNNEARTNYTLIIATTETNASVDIGDVIHITGTNQPIVVKGTALSTNPNDYWLIKWNISTYGMEYFRATLQDLVSASQTIDITSQSTPLLFCGENYDDMAIDYDGIGFTYDVENTYREDMPAIHCLDTNPSGEYSAELYMKIPVPAGLRSDNFVLSYEIGGYDAII